MSSFAYDDDSDDPALDALLRAAAHLDDEPPAVTLPLPGRIVGEKYRIEARIGRGGMGAVYRATHVVSQKQVALKWMLRSASNERAQRRFLREARAAARIDHPNVVDVYDLGQDGEGAYLVMELLHGESLRARMGRARVPGAEALDLLLPAMRGVSAVHAAGVIHRDLKPENIFLCQAPDGSAREAKVLDFGISAIAESAASDPTLSREGALLGTPAYLPPERLTAGCELDVRTDVYAFGVMLYELLSGVLPFEADSDAALIFAIARATPTPLRRRCPELPAGLEREVMRALARLPAQRHESVDALISALSPFASQSPAPVARRRRWWWLAAALLGCVLLASWTRGPAHVSPARPRPARAATLPATAAAAAQRLSAPVADVAPVAVAAPAAPVPRKRKHAARRGVPEAPAPQPAKQEARSGGISVDEL